ncbi:MAG TPA: TRAP transporter small permease [Albitalea sp.]|nr:TRAP transporter small permease [Albitalea sp.]HJW12074.1 TRAP transporter small permease [Albitalea sp.]
MSAGPAHGRDPELAALPAWLASASRAVYALNEWLLRVGMLALLAAAAVLTASVFLRYFLHAATDWQDETAVFLLVGATFLCGAHVQQLRGHIGIDAVVGFLSPRWNRRRQALVDALSLLFCAFFAWKSWALLAEAVHEGQRTGSSWAPPLWIPYGLMASGMSLLCVQLLLQWLARLLAKERT